MHFYTNIDRYGNKLLYRGISNGKRVTKKIPFEPTFYIPDNNGNSEWSSLHGRPLSEFKPGNMREAKEFLDRYEDVDNFEIHGTTNYIHQFISDTWTKDIKFDITKLNITAIDIEVGSEDGFPEPEEAKHEITAITLKDFNRGHFFTWGVGDFDTESCEQNVIYRQAKDERELLLDFLAHWEECMPDILTGWFSESFDIPYLVNRIARLFGDDMVKTLSPWRRVERNDVPVAGKVRQQFDIIGITQLDYIDIFKKFTLNTLGVQESYKLDHIAWVVLGEKKLDYSEHGTLHGLYKNDFQKYIRYNIKDVELIQRIDENLALIELVLVMAYRSKCGIAETLGTVGIWDATLLNEFRKRKIAVPPKVIKQYNTIEGGYVKDPKPGMYEWVVSFDLNSLYPHIIMQYNMSPETIVDHRVPGITVDYLLEALKNDTSLDIPENMTMTATGQCFRNNKSGIIPEVIESYYAERSKTKTKMLELKKEYEKTEDKETKRAIGIQNNIQMSIKIMMNSLYGAMANKYFRYFDIRMAESITVSGQLTIRWAEHVLNEFMNELLKTKNVDYVIAIDTDSVYLDMSGLVKQILGDNPDTQKAVDFLSKASPKFEKKLEEAYTFLAKKLQAPQQKMVMAREIIADKAIWTAKKRYIAHVWDSEGVRYKEPELKVTGIEAVRSSTPAACREMIKDTLKLIMTADEATVQREIEQLRKKFWTLPPEDIAFPRGVSDMEKYMDKSSLYKSGTPIHVRAAILYNEALKDYNLSHKYEIIQSGNKMKFLYMKKPNPIFENVFGFETIFPRETELEKYIDYDLQFEKAFVDPIQAIMTAIGWNVEAKGTLEDLFG